MNYLILALSFTTITLSACSNTPTVPTENTTSSSSVASVVSSAMTSGQQVMLRLDSLSVSGVLPSSWGAASDVETNEFGEIVGGPYTGEFLNTQSIDASMIASSLILADYPQMQPGGYSLGVPAIEIMRYPDTFVDDAEGDYQAMTADQKSAVITPMIQIYNQRGIGSLQLTQADVNAEPLYRGGWWGNGGYRSDRMNVRYIENAAGDLRGIAFFANEGQDYGFHPVYKIVLINPAKRMLFTAYLPLSNFDEFRQFQSEMQNDSTQQDIIDAQMSGYAYLNDPTNYMSGELGTFVEQADSLAKSMKIL